MEKTLKRFTWLVSVTALVVFGSLATFNVIASNSANDEVQLLVKLQFDAGSACHKDETQCQFVESAQAQLDKVIAAGKYGVELADLAGTFFVLTLTAPLTVWFLFFSFRWVLTGRKPWQRESLPLA